MTVRKSVVKLVRVNVQLNHPSGELQGSDLDGGGGEDGEALLGGQDFDEAQDEELHGDALERGVQRHVIGQHVCRAVHASHALKPLLYPHKGQAAWGPRHLGIRIVHGRDCRPSVPGDPTLQQTLGKLTPDIDFIHFTPVNDCAHPTYTSLSMS